MSTLLKAGEHQLLGPNNSFKPTPHRGVNSALCATLHAVDAPPQGGLTQALGPMKASRLAKIEQHLTSSELELHEMLSVLLPRVVSSGEMMFFNSENLPDMVQAQWLSPESEALLAIANSCIALRQHIGVPVNGSIGQLFLSACHEAADATNNHSRGPRQLASWLLSQMPTPSGA